MSETNQEKPDTLCRVWFSVSAFFLVSGTLAGLVGEFSPLPSVALALKIASVAMLFCGVGAVVALLLAAETANRRPAAPP